MLSVCLGICFGFYAGHANPRRPHLDQNSPAQGNRKVRLAWWAVQREDWKMNCSFEAWRAYEGRDGYSISLPQANFVAS